MKLKQEKVIENRWVNLILVRIRTARYYMGRKYN